MAAKKAKKSTKKFRKLPKIKKGLAHGRKFGKKGYYYKASAFGKLIMRKTTKAAITRAKKK